MRPVFIDYERFGSKTYMATIYTVNAIEKVRGWEQWSVQKYAKVKKRLRKFYKNLLKDRG